MSTLSSRAISGSGFWPLLYAIDEVREITRMFLTCARLAVSASVSPSTKYSCFASPEKFASGSTATAVSPGLRRSRTAARCAAGAADAFFDS